MGARGFVHDSLGLALSQYLSRAFLLARGVVTAACLGPAGFGAWNALTLILDYGAYAPFGALNGLDRKLPPSLARGEATFAERLQRGAWSATLVGGSVFSLGVVAALAAGNWLPRTGWGWGAPGLALAALFLQLAIQYHATALRAAGDFSRVSVGGALQGLVGAGLGIATVASMGVWGLLGGWIVGSLASLVVLRGSPHRPPLSPGHMGAGWRLAAAGLPMLGFFLLALLLRSIDRVALVRFGGNEVLGLYSLGLIAAGLILYVPESVGAVLFPRVAAAAEGARDREQTRNEVLRAQRALCVLLPLLVGPGVLWAPWVVARVLPAYTAGLEPLAVLAGAALLLSTATLPSYYLLGLGRWKPLLWAASGAVAVGVAVTVSVASLDSRPATVAWAATVGYGGFAIAMLGAAAPDLAPGGRERAALVATTWLPVLAAALLLLALERGADRSAAAALVRTAIFLVGYLPVVFVLGRGLGLPRRLGLRTRP